jgi:hypothetical protein
MKQTKRQISQEILVRDALETGKVITPIDALESYGVFRLAAVIYKLRKQGMDIITYTDPENRNYAQYSMATV